MRATVLLLLVAACAACSASPRYVPASMPAADPDEQLQTNDIYQRDAVSNHTVVEHVLISWKDLPDAAQTAAAQGRTHEAANALAQDLLKRARAGESMEALMKQFSDDGGSAATGKSYDVTPDAGLVFEFKHLGLRLNVGEVGLVKSKFGWHIIKRVQ